LSFGIPARPFVKGKMKKNEKFDASTGVGTNYSKSKRSHFSREKKNTSPGSKKK